MVKPVRPGRRGGRRLGAGRPPGRPNNVTLEIGELARSFGAEALKVLVSIMRDAKKPAASRVTAAGMILDRAYGRPNLPIGVDVKINPEDLSDAELARILAECGAWKPPGWSNGSVADDRDLN